MYIDIFKQTWNIKKRSKNFRMFQTIGMHKINILFNFFIVKVY